MKQTLLSFLLMFLPMLANAAIEIDGIYYNLDTDAKTAEVTRLNRNQKYSGDVMIPSSVTYEEIDYCVTSIARQAFYNCSELTSVTIPNSMTSIGNEAFRNCSNLTKVELNSNAMVSKDYDAGSSINEIFGSQVKEYVLGDEVTGIGNYAFFGCSNLISVHMSDYVTTIGEGAFSQCYQLTSFEMPNNVESIGTLAFNMCYSLTAITIPSSLTNLDYWTFPGCSGLTKVELNSNAIVSKDFGTSLGSYFGVQVEEYVLGEEVTSIGKRAFAGCYGLTSIVIPSNLTSIGDNAFQNCSALTSISIPSNLTSIGDNAFYNCNGLLSIQVENGNLVYDSRENCNAIIKTADNTIILGCQNTIIPNSVTIIGDNAFYSCADLTSISIPTGVEIIGDCAFCGCKGLTTIDIPNSVTSIGKYAFASCEGLTSVTIPYGVTTIDEYAFAWCSNLLAITIANSVTTIGEGAFIRTGLKDMYCYSEQVPETGNNIFDYSNRKATLHVPAASVEAYSNAEQWKDFGIIVALTDSDPIPTEIIASTTAQQSQIVDCYDLNGRRIIQPQRGINIFKMSDGTTKMVLVK